MKQWLLGCLLIAGLHVTGFAQEGAAVRTPEERAQRQTEMLAQKLNLTDAQKTKIYEVNLKTATQLQKFRQANDTANAHAIRTAGDAAYKNILTPEQYAQYEVLKQRRMERRNGWRQRSQDEGRDN